MTTTACDDQFSAEPEPVHQPYDVAAILRKNVADLELELQRQKERAEKAEAELNAAREQEPVAHVTDTEARMVWWSDKFTHISQCPERNTPLYASPIPAPAVPAPEIPDGDDFNGTTPHLIQCIEALVRMNDRGVLVPHGIGSHARTLLLASANRLRQQAAPAVPEDNCKRFTDDDLAEIHQLAYELGGTDSGEYLLDGDQLDLVVVKCASLFYAFPVQSAPASAVPEDWRTDDPQLGEVIIVKRNEGLPFVGVFRTMPCRSCINRETGKWVGFSEWISLTTLLQSAEVTK